MSMWSTMSAFVQKTFTTATKSLDSVEKSLDIGNHFVDVNHKRLTKTMTQDAILAVAVHHNAIAHTLDEDADLKKQFDTIAKDW